MVVTRTSSAKISVCCQNDERSRRSINLATLVQCFGCFTLRWLVVTTCDGRRIWGDCLDRQTADTRDRSVNRARRKSARGIDDGVRKGSENDGRWNRTRSDWIIFADSVSSQFAVWGYSNRSIHVHSSSEFANGCYYAGVSPPGTQSR